MSVLTSFTKAGFFFSFGRREQVKWVIFPKGTQGAVYCSFLAKNFMYFQNPFSVNFTICNHVGFLVSSFGIKVVSFSAILLSIIPSKCLYFSKELSHCYNTLIWSTINTNNAVIWVKPKTVNCFVYIRGKLSAW